MAQTTLALPWAFRQLARLYQQRPEIVNNAIARLIQDDQDLRWSLVLNAYRDSQINLGKAAEMLDLHELELRDRFIQLGIPLRLGPADLAEAQAEVDALEAWFGQWNTGDSDAFDENQAAVTCRSQFFVGPDNLPGAPLTSCG